jgi:hypothetical protein
MNASPQTEMLGISSSIEAKALQKIDDNRRRESEEARAVACLRRACLRRPVCADDNAKWKTAGMRRRLQVDYEFLRLFTKSLRVSLRSGVFIK